jgi:hypothetical protein
MTTETAAERLQLSVDQLTAELQAVRTSLLIVDSRLTRQTRVSWTAIAVGIVVALVLGFTVVDNHRSIVANNQLLCPLIGILASTEPPRTTPAGKQMAHEAGGLLRSPAYNCQ